MAYSPTHDLEEVRRAAGDRTRTVLLLAAARGWAAQLGRDPDELYLDLELRRFERLAVEQLGGDRQAAE